MNIAYVIDWRRPNRERWSRADMQTTSGIDVDSLGKAAESIAVRYDLWHVPTVADGNVIRVRAWRYDGIDDLMALDPDADADAPDSVWTYDPTT